jgi:hypothetical protein
MARLSPRISFNSSTFIRLLSELAVDDVEVPRQPFAERLGLWLDWTAAIPLSAALQASAPAPALTQHGASAASATDATDATDAVGQAETDAVARVRAEIAQAIATDPVLTAPLPGAPQARPSASAVVVERFDFLPYQRCYQAHQRLMQARIAPLRAQVRATLARQSAALAKLAALDAVLDRALALRERSQLATVPALLATRFARLQQAHLAAQAITQGCERPGPDPGQPPPADAWLVPACREMQSVLAAELDIRLQPVLGLVDALCNRLTTQT